MIENIKRFIHFPRLVQRRVFFLWSCFFLFQVGFLLIWILTSTLFLKLFGVSQIPFLFLFEGVCVLLSSLVTRNYFLNTQTNTFIKNAIWGILSVIVVAFLFQANLTLVLVLGVLAKSLIYPQIQLGLFKKVESLFSPNLAIKAIPFIETAETFGMVVGSGALLFVLQISNEVLTLFFWWALPLLGLLFLLNSETTWIKKIKELPSENQTKNLANDMKSLRSFLKQGFARNFALLIFVQAALFTILEISFLHEIEGHHVSAEAPIAQSFDFLQANLFDTVAVQAQAIEQKVFSTASKTVAHELGVFALLAGIVALFFKLFFTPILVKRLGIFGTIASFFGFFLLGAFAFLMGKTSAEMLKGIQHGTYSVFASPYHLSFYSFNEAVREKMRHFLHGIVWPLGSIVSAGLLWFVTFDTFSLFGLTLLALCLVLWLCKRFSLFTFGGYKASETLEEKMHMLELLESFQQTSVPKKLATELLNRRQPYFVRKKIIETLTMLQDSSVVHEYLHILNNENEDDEILICVLEALYRDTHLKQYCAEKAFTANKMLKTWQTLFAFTTHRHVKKLVLMNIFKHIANEKTVEFFRQILTAGDEHLLAISLRSCVYFDDPEIVSEIVPLLDHPSSRIRSHAILAIWKFSSDRDRLQGYIDEMLQSSESADVISGVYAVGELRCLARVKKIESLLPKTENILRVQCLVALLKLGQKQYVSALSHIITGKNERLANMAFHMRKRLPESVQEFLEDVVYKQISQKVDEVLVNEFDLKDLQSKDNSYLRRLLLFSEEYESLASL